MKVPTSLEETLKSEDDSIYQKISAISTYLNTCNMQYVQGNISEEYMKYLVDNLNIVFQAAFCRMKTGEFND